jgi:hypothetical protein
MPFIITWDELNPVDGTAASTIDNEFRDLKLSISERLLSVFPDFKTALTRIHSGVVHVDSAIGFKVKKSDDTVTFFEITDAGAVTFPSAVSVAFPTAIVGSVAITGNLAITGQAYSVIKDDGNSGVAKTINFDEGNVHLLTLTGNCTLTLSNPQAGASYLLLLKQDGVGGRTITWPGTVKWGGGIAPTIPVTVANTIIISLVWQGSAYAGSVFGSNYTGL